MNNVKIYMLPRTVEDADTTVRNELATSQGAEYSVTKLPAGNYIAVVSGGTLAAPAVEIAMSATDSGAKHEFQFTSTVEQTLTLVEFLAAQERDLYCHQFNLQRYDAMLADASINGAFRSKIEQLRAETVERIAEVSAIIRHTIPQLTGLRGNNQ